MTYRPRLPRVGRHIVALAPYSPIAMGFLLEYKGMYNACLQAVCKSII
jgi:hypothetical protein